jgi:uncharacterized membrane protein (DUF485 family)/rhodanese-related sulfurtransferase
MSIFPLDAFLHPLAQNPWTYVVFALIGFGFGFVLEISGFGNSKKLAAQFYFKDLTVLKVMFTAIVTAMVLIFFSVAIGILDFNKIWVNPTYLWPGIVGGLIMGVGFIVGGFCPGTSLVSAATLKLDGIFFATGTLFGVWAFGETVDWYWEWWNTSGYYGRLTLMDVFNLSNGVVVLLVIFMALFMFWGGEQLERIIGKRDLTKEPRVRLAGAGALVVGALAIVLIGQPTTLEKYSSLVIKKEVDGQTVQLRPDEILSSRQVQIHPGELLASLADDRLRIVMLDVRAESDFNLFHIQGAQRMTTEEIPVLAKEWVAAASPNTIFVLMSNDEEAATQGWKQMMALGVPNSYILEGGINNWLNIFAAEEPEIMPTPTAPGGDKLAYRFPAALGARYAAASPNPHEWEFEYTPKIILQLKRDKSGGGCG